MKRKKVFIVDVRECTQRHLEESRTERKISILNMASTLRLAMRWGEPGRKRRSQR